MGMVLGWVVFGALTGWLASQIVNKQGEGCLVNTALGLVGAVVGGFLFRLLVPGFQYENHGFFISMLVAVIGAVIVLFVYHAATGSRTLR
jgi:uncharacterized membrane protein YeaQ/YmgE (transglycosylase-associated protein family)